MAETRKYTDEQWLRMKDKIHDLYIVEGKSLDNVREVLALNDFRPTLNRLKNMLKQWNFQKYSNAAQWRALDEVLKRKGLDLEKYEQNEIEVDGRTFTIKKLKKELRRHGAHSHASASEKKVVVEANPTRALHQPLPIANEHVVGTTSTEHLSRPENTVLTLRNKKNTTSGIRVPAADGAVLLQLPMFNLLRALLPMLGPLAQHEQSSDYLISVYSKMRIYLLDTVMRRRDTDHFKTEDDTGRCIVLDGLQCLRRMMRLGTRSSWQNGLHHEDKARCVEAVLPDIRPEEQWYPIQHSTLYGVDFERTASIYFICYLCINCFIDSNVLDNLVKWTCTIPSVQQALQEIILTNSPLFHHLRTELLHAAIRTGRQEWAVQLVDTLNSQFGLAEAKMYDGGCITMKVSPLKNAILAENVEMVLSLISAGVKVDSVVPAYAYQIDGGSPFLHGSPLELALQDQKTLCLWQNLVCDGAGLKGVGAVVCAVLSGAPWSLILPLIERGADVHETYKIGRKSDWGLEESEISAVHAASISGNADVLRSLLNLKLNVNGLIREKNAKHNGCNCIDTCCFKKPPGKTPLILAIESRHFDIAQILLSFGADLNEQEPLIAAITSGAYEFASTLLAFGAAPCWPRSQHVSKKTISEAPLNLLHNLFEHGLAAVFGDVKSCEQALISFAEYGSPDSMQCLLLAFQKSYAHVGRTYAIPKDQLITSAIRGGNLTMAKHLASFSQLAGEPEIDVDKEQLLKLAARSGSIATFQYAIEHYATCFFRLNALSDTEKRQYVKDCLLTVAFANGHVASVVALLEDGASPHGGFSANEWVGSPIISALSDKNRDICAELLRLLYNYGIGSRGIRDAFWDAVNDTDHDILDETVDFLVLNAIVTKEHLSEYLVVRDNNDRTLYDRIHDGNVSWSQGDTILKFFIRLGMSIEHLDRRTILVFLLLAVQRQNFHLADLLFEAQTDIALVSQDLHAQQTYQKILDSACGYGYPGLIKKIFRRATVIDWSKSDCLDMVTENGFLGILELLLRAGPNVPSANWYPRQTAVLNAAHIGRLDTVILLLAHCKHVKELHDCTYKVAWEWAALYDQVLLVQTLNEYASLVGMLQAQAEDEFQLDYLPDILLESDFEFD